MSLDGARRWFARAAMLAGSGVIGLLGAELIVRAFVPVRDIGPPLTEYDPVLGKRLKADLHCVRETPEFRMSFSSNSAGWRGPEPAAPTAEILFLGDSFTMGYGVDDGWEFPQLVASALGVSVVNMGLGGSGNGRWPLLLRGEAASFEPQVIVLQLCSNDLDDNLGEGLASLDDEGVIALQPPRAPSTGRRLQALLDVVPWLGDSHLVGLVRQSRLRKARAAAAGLASADTRGLDLTRALLEESIRLCAEQGWKVVVLSADMTSSEADPFAESCRRAGVPFVRMPSKSEAPEHYFAVDGHWTAAGHRKAADLLLPWLR